MGQSASACLGHGPRSSVGVPMRSEYAEENSDPHASTGETRLDAMSKAHVATCAAHPAAAASALLRSLAEGVPVAAAAQPPFC